jgi:glyoxylase-like metal-dependent hydrolase (beta-lactamase superfamily II)
MTRKLDRLAAVTFALLGAVLGYTQTPQAPPAQKQQTKQPAPLTLHKMADDLYMVEGSGGNVAFYVTNEGVIVVDDKFEQDFDNIMAHVRSVTTQPIRYVLNTHHHGDHSGGNAKFLASNAEIILHANARKNMVTGNQPGIPRLSFADEFQVVLGGKEVRSRHFGRGHTNGDAFIYFPAHRTIHTGDMMANNSPFIDYANGGSALEWTKTLDEVLKLDFDTVIPGHGAITNKAGLQNYRNNIVKLRERAIQLSREGRPQTEIATALRAEFNFTRPVDTLLAELK